MQNLNYAQGRIHKQAIWVVSRSGTRRTKQETTHRLVVDKSTGSASAGIPLSALRSWTPSRCLRRSATAAIILIVEIGGNAQNRGPLLNHVKNR